MTFPFNYGIPSFRYDPINQDKFFIPEIFKDIKVIKNISEIRYLKDLHNPNLKKFQVNQGDIAVRNIANVIKKIVTKDRSDIKYSLPQDFKFVTKILGSLVFRLLFKLKILFILRKSTSFKFFYDDVPPSWMK